MIYLIAILIIWLGFKYGTEPLFKSLSETFKDFMMNGGREKPVEKKDDNININD